MNPKPVLFTLYENDYHYGVAALINSALHCGFPGEVHVFHRGGLPPWAGSLERTDQDGGFVVGGVPVTFQNINPLRHLGYHKPFAALEVLDKYSQCQAVFYCDPDLVFLSPWEFFEDWVGQGVAVCQDSHFPFLSADHPWRAEWRQLLVAAGQHVVTDSPYANGGFFGVSRRDAEFLRIWSEVTLAYESTGNDTRGFRMSERHRAVVGCQDLMSASLMGWGGPRSTVGPEGMGFTGYHFLLSHDINHPKAWRCPFIRRALGGYPPTRAAGLFLEQSDGPIRAFSRGQLAIKRLSYRVGQLISRVWRR